MTHKDPLLKDLKAQVDLLQDDLRRRAEAVPELDTALRGEYETAKRAKRTADTFETWREDPITQAAVAWVLGTVFVRFLEDNALIEPRLSGPPEGRRFALDRQAAYFQEHPLETDREYLLHVFRDMTDLPAAREVFDEGHNALWQLTPSGDAAKALLELWQRIDPATGTIAHDFVDPAWDTHMLGDLYQDLSESARKKYALLQTPRFVSAFILDRSLTPAIETFGYREVTLIDPTCGSGHFLLGTFERLLRLYEANEPAVHARERVQRALSQISGVDINPFASAIARFRLLIAALQACGITRLRDAPGFEIQVATGDSLIHGRRFADERAMRQRLEFDEAANHHFRSEDPGVDRLLGRQYHVVVGNPPYITVKDRALNDLYRQRYGSCHMKYSLVVPFVERFFELAMPANGVLALVHAEHETVADQPSAAGFVGLIVGNSYMKREFGKKLIEDYLPRVDLTHVLDTSGAYIPGHGTPTVILFGRNRGPTGKTRTVMGIRGEPSTPADPARGQVWSAILAQIDVVDSESAFVSVRDLEQAQFHSHPWSIGGGGASELKEVLDERAQQTLADVAAVIGVIGMTNADEVMIADATTFHRFRVSDGYHMPLTLGDEIRDWTLNSVRSVLFPYQDEQLLRPTDAGYLRWLWPTRIVLGNRATFGGGTYFSEGRPWWEWHQICLDRLRTPLTITFAEVATHNHFVLDRGGKVFNRTAPVIKLPPGASEEAHFALLGLLNSSSACFWMKQVSHNKGATSDSGVLQDDPERFRFHFNGTKLGRLPIPDLSSGQRHNLLVLTEALDKGGKQLSNVQLLALIEHPARALSTTLDDRGRDRDHLRGQMVRWQEELDWLVYEIFGLLPETSPARSLAWTMIPGDMPALTDAERPYRDANMPTSDLAGQVHSARCSAISELPAIGLMERPEFKRRWFRSAGAYSAENLSDVQMVATSLRTWLLDRLETPPYWPTPAALQTTAKLADVARQDAELMSVAEVFRGRPDFDVTALVTELMTAEAVPYLPVLRYAESGMRKRAQWERTWELQRAEDGIDARVELPEGNPLRLSKEQAARMKAEQVGEIPVPPKYSSADFKKSDYWRLRGKLDVPKERFIIYPGAERSVDPTPVVGWAGWDHLQQAQALADYYIRMQEQEGWSVDRLTPLLGGLLELVPWLRQWHNDLAPQFQVRMGDYFADFVETQGRTLGVTLEQVRAWTPAQSARRPRRKSAAP